MSIEDEQPAPRASVSDTKPECLAPEIQFLDDGYFNKTDLLRATQLAEIWGVTADEVLLSTNRVREEDYYRALADHAGLQFTELQTSAPNWSEYVRIERRAVAKGDIALLGTGPHGIELAHAPRGRSARRVASLSENPDLAGRLRKRIFVTTPSAIRKVIVERYEDTFLSSAINGLLSKSGVFSAKGWLTIWQIAFLLVAILLVGVAAIYFPIYSFVGWAGISAAVFLFVTGLRLFAVGLRFIVGEQLETPPRTNIPDSELPTYTLLVPLYKEANVMAALVRSLTDIDYPPAKLDIKIILESDDEETRQKARELNLPNAFDVIVVPKSEPRTKPKALAYAMRFARGSHVVIYDAEDRPETDQLRKAVAAFKAGDKTLACLQARLGLYNADQNWLTTQFTIEYAALFNVMLPALQWLDAPLPLGGTSNHFKREHLEAVGGWDPFNVTEDADLGIRLARFGYRSAVLDSTTYEEACSDFPNWLGQRTRWFKGWLQTWAVHMRQPFRSWRELGLRGYLTLHLMLGGILVSAIVHPLFLIALIWSLFGEFLFQPPIDTFDHLLLGLNLWNLVAGYIGGVALGLAGLSAAGLIKFRLQTVFIPVYWLLISIAAYRAVGQFVRRPFYWEKTRHGMAGANERNPRQKNIS